MTTVSHPIVAGPSSWPWLRLFQRPAPRASNFGTTPSRARKAGPANHTRRSHTGHQGARGKIETGCAFGSGSTSKGGHRAAATVGPTNYWREVELPGVPPMYDRTLHTSWVDAQQAARALSRSCSVSRADGYAAGGCSTRTEALGVV